MRARLLPPPPPTYEVLAFDRGRAVTLYRNLPSDAAAEVVALYAHMGIFVSCRRTPVTPYPLEDHSNEM